MAKSAEQKKLRGRTTSALLQQMEMSIESLTRVSDEMLDPKKPKTPGRSEGSGAPTSPLQWDGELARARAEAIDRCPPQKPVEDQNDPKETLAHEGETLPIGSLLVALRQQDALRGSRAAA
eukprot:11608751-Heterocapsa_arctica.AAC.1